ncbi:MAG: tRNA pseudouridine(38-40) synthase TruA [Candidatus Thorarchaeota archaeon]|nr:tRNA pseudouridine(38-40) synthase TruA [Candidatus Thorarchaeota archaeon]
MTAYIARLFYLGASYHGSQWQPNVRTIQGELIDTLHSWNGEEYTRESVVISGRTDRGVNSIGQVVKFHSNKPLNLDKINTLLPEDIVLWAYSKAPAEFNPRYDVLSRHYKYYLSKSNHSMDLEKIKEGAKLLVGTHNYALLSKPDAGRNTRTTILDVSVRSNNDTLVFDFFGVRFLWKLVRKSVTLLKWIGLSLYSPSIISDLLTGKETIPGGIDPALPEGLVLIEAIVPIRMKPSMNALKLIRKVVNSRFGYFKRSATMLEGINADHLFDRVPLY